MTTKEEKEAIDAIKSWLEEGLKGHEWMVAAEKKMKTRERTLRSILSLLPSEDLAFSPGFELNLDVDFIVAASPPIKAVCKELSKKEDAGYSYTIELRGQFVYEMLNCEGKLLSETHKGLFLTLLSPESKVAGILGVHVGLPFEIWVAQGDNLGETQKFFNASGGKSYDVALVEHFIRCIGRSVHFPKGHPLRQIPKAEFSILEGDQMNESALRRLSQYVPSRERVKFVKGDLELGTFMNLKGHAPIEERHFRRAGAKQMRQLAIRH